MKVGKTLLLSAVVLLSTELVSAHHSVISQFDLSKPITVRGTLTKLEWVNPHAFIYLSAKGPDGKVQNWKFETGSPLRMEKRGLKREYFRSGTEIIVGGFASRGKDAGSTGEAGSSSTDGTQTAAGWVINFPDRENSGQEASFPLGR